MPVTMPSETIEKTLLTVHLELRLEEGILLGKWNEPFITLDVAKQAVEARLRFCEGSSHPALIDMRKIKSVTKEAREYLAREGAEGIRAGALLIGSPLTRMLGNIFLQINKPEVPTRLFTSEESAKQWLRKFL